MSDIYHTLTRYNFKNDDEEDLRAHIAASTDAYHGIMSGLQVIGNLAVSATSNLNENYDDDSARSDLSLLGSTLIQLTRIAQAVIHNRENAEFELCHRKPGVSCEQEA